MLCRSVYWAPVDPSYDWLPLAECVHASEAQYIAEVLAVQPQAAGYRYAWTDADGALTEVPASTTAR
ncbi:MAG: hypothetical protein KGL39_20770 [Patescibacteria group bacterium]|nr:hypothetical protein [Patescibacteria group bacterium]